MNILAALAVCVRFQWKGDRQLRPDRLLLEMKLSWRVERGSEKWCRQQGVGVTNMRGVEAA